MTDQELLDYCNEHLSYNRDSGIIINKDTSRNVRAGVEAGSLFANGYRNIYLNGRVYGSHRIAFLMYYKYLPENIDHINGIRDDNRNLNLRGCNSLENSWNYKPTSRNKSGYKGVCWYKALNKWRAQINHKGKRYHLGFFKSKDNAARSYNTASRMYHGEFGYINELNSTLAIPLRWEK